MRNLLALSFAGSMAIAAGCAGVKAGATVTPTGDAGTTGTAGQGGAAGTHAAVGAAGAGASTGGAAGCGAASCAPRCGDGKLDPGEVCDDGNTRSGDGCSSDCKTIETDYACPTPGRPCTYLVKCGDGMLGGIEQCDPPNVGHGCSADCRIEPGYVCNPPPTPANPNQPATCHKTVCGDGVKEGAEACDDHNLVDGDGCSSTCMIETGFSCTDTTAPPPAQLNLAVTYRDMISFPIGTAVRHPDFEIFAGMDVTPNLVKAAADANGKPVMDGRCTQPGVTAQCPYDQQLTTAANFAQWYHDASGVNLDIPGTVLLAKQANGSYVFDSGNRGFYPVDTKGWTVSTPAKETTSYANATVNDGLPHDFGFTTEIHYFFQYRGGESLTFSGDDDVWIFFNRTLALDIGGLHPRIEKTLNVDQSAATLGVTVGGLYEIALFHAERHSDASNFKLTLTGFAPTTSTCRSACGDGVKAANEQCDDGNNIDGDGCSHDCKIEIIVN